MATPTIGGFLTFVRGVMGISAANLPDSAPVITVAYNIAVELVNKAILQASPMMYELAVYNLGGDNLINYAPNPPAGGGADPVYFSSLRDNFNILKFIPGVIQSSSDEGTSESMVIQEAAKNFTLANIQNLKTPWGRAYLGIAQRYGVIWGLS